MLVDFTSSAAKDRARRPSTEKCSKAVRVSSIFVDDDLTLAQLSTRQGLRPAFVQLKEQGLRGLAHAATLDGRAAL